MTKSFTQMNTVSKETKKNIHLMGWSEKVQVYKYSPVDCLTKQTNAFNIKTELVML